MLPSALLAKTQKDFTKSDNLGVSETITYTQRKTGNVTADLKAFVDVVEVRAEKGRDKYDEVSFHNVDLGFTPHKKDYITYDGKELIVDAWNKEHGLYTITTLSNESFSIRRQR